MDGGAGVVGTMSGKGHVWGAHSTQCHSSYRGPEPHHFLPPLMDPHAAAAWQVLGASCKSLGNVGRDRVEHFARTYAIGWLQASHPATPSMELGVSPGSMAVSD